MFTDDYKNNFEEVTDEINKIALSSIEYKNYLYFNYIIEDLKKVYKKKENYKNESCCWQKENFNYRGIEKALCGKTIYKEADVQINGM